MAMSKQQQVEHISHRTPDQRDALIDALRAVALAGVILMNMMTFSGLAYLTPGLRADLLGAADNVAWDLLRVLVDGKALAAFCFMFGVSFSLVLRRMDAASNMPLARLFRRLSTLFLIGVFNAVFLFWADILMTYALLGMLLPIAARLPLRLLTVIASLLILAGPLWLALSGLGAVEPVPRGHVERIEGYASAMPGDVVRQNVEMLQSASHSADNTLIFRVFMLSGLFLLGLATGRSGILGKLVQQRRRLLRVGLLLTLCGLIGKLTLRFAVDPVGVLALLNLHLPVTSLGYLMVIATVLSSPALAWLVERLAPLGRMTLSGYLLSAVAGQLIFYGWGFGLIGKLGTLAVIIVVAVVYLLLMVFAHWWFQRYQIGPWEWLWHSMSRLRVHPLRPGGG